jgi:deazaflavin-dependent oxidoreductase (nitroreductase family)
MSWCGLRYWSRCAPNWVVLGRRHIFGSCLVFSVMMSTPAAQPHSHALNSQFVPVGPSVIVRLVLGPLAKLLNPLVGTLAGRRFVPLIARIHHVGRRSGKPYTTPTGAGLVGNTIVIPLSFGNVSDWARNVRAAGQCTVQLGGKSYHATKPQFVDAAEVKPVVGQSFGAVNRFAFRLLGIRQYLFLRTTD